MEQRQPGLGWSRLRRPLELRQSAPAPHAEQSAGHLEMQGENAGATRSATKPLKFSQLHPLRSFTRGTEERSQQRRQCEVKKKTPEKQQAWLGSGMKDGCQMSVFGNTRRRMDAAITFVRALTLARHTHPIC